MENDTTLQYLQENRIEDHNCDLAHNFAFFSYAHDDHDAAIVRRVFGILTSRGYNIWLDAANIPHDTNSWENAAMTALKSDLERCKAVIYFRSEASITRSTIVRELETYSGLPCTADSDIITVEIYKDHSVHTKDFLNSLKAAAEASPDDRSAISAYQNCSRICNVVNTSCSALRFYHDDIKGDISVLADKIEQELISHGVLQRFSLPDKIPYILDGSFSVSLQGDQAAVYNVFASIKNRTFGPDGDGKKRTLIVNGGPGTGKTVLIMYMLSALMRHDPELSVIMTSKNASPRTIYENNIANDPTLPSAEKRSLLDRFKKVFRGQESVVNLWKANGNGRACDILFVDEGHRLVTSSRYIGGETNCLDAVLNAAPVTIIFVDDDQCVTMDDKGTTDRLLEHTEATGAEIYTAEMQSQLRCRGSNSYVKWIDGIFSNSASGRYVTKTSEYDLRVFDDPGEMYEAIKEKDRTEGLSRLVAGYCWEWKKDGRDDQDVHDIEVGDFRISWNLDNAFATKRQSEKKNSRPDSINEAGCVHTVQGLEFLYCGVIIGPDMRYEDGRIITDFTQRARTDKSLSGIKKLYKEDAREAEQRAAKIIRNTYKVLMTRGLKGCFIYCTDKPLNEYLKKMAERFNASYHLA